MVQISRLLFAACLVAVGSATPVERNAAPLIACINGALHTGLNNLDSAIKGFPASGLQGALNIHSVAETVETALEQCTTAAHGLTLTEDEATTILSALQTQVPIITDSLSRLVADKAAFNALPIAGITSEVHSDLQALNTATAAFNSAVAATAPAGQKAGINAVASQVDGDFSIAIQAYA